MNRELIKQALMQKLATDPKKYEMILHPDKQSVKTRRLGKEEAAFNDAKSVNPRPLRERLQRIDEDLYSNLHDSNKKFESTTRDMPGKLDRIFAGLGALDDPGPSAVDIKRMPIDKQVDNFNKHLTQNRRKAMLLAAPMGIGQFAAGQLGAMHGGANPGILPGMLGLAGGQLGYLPGHLLNHLAAKKLGEKATLEHMIRNGKVPGQALGNWVGRIGSLAGAYMLPRLLAKPKNNRE